MLRLILTMVLLAGCRSHKEPNRSDWVLAHHDAGALSSRIEIGDTNTLWQRLEGFYAIQDKSWAWTAPSFSVLLAAPHPHLRVRFWLAPPQMDQLKELTLRARVNGVELAPETYRKSGAQTYVRALDSKWLERPIRVDFTVDDVFRPQPPDARRLGIVINSIAIEEQ